MLVDRLLVCEHEVAIRAVRDGHDVHVAKLGASLAPVAMRENVEPSDFAASLELAPLRHRPMKERIEPRHALAVLQRLDMFEKRRKAADDPALIEASSGVDENLERHARFASPGLPEIAPHLLRLQLALQCREHLPLEIGEHDFRRVSHDRELVRLTAGLHSFPPHVADA
jgi:hypothetical protein